MGKDIKKPEDYKTAKYTLYLYQRKEGSKDNLKLKGSITCTNSGREIKFNYMGQLIDFITKSLVVVEKKYTKNKK